MIWNREVCQVTTWRKITLAALEEAIKNVADAQAVELHLHWQNLAKDSDLVAARDVTAKAQFALRNVAKRVQKAQKEYSSSSTEWYIKPSKRPAKALPLHIMCLGPRSFKIAFIQ